MKSAGILSTTSDKICISAKVNSPDELFISTLSAPLNTLSDKVTRLSGESFKEYETEDAGCIIESKCEL